MSKKILLLTYYFPPCNFIGANRPNSWAQNFFNSGIYPTVVTRHWKGNEKYWADYHVDNLSEMERLDTPTCSIIRLPYKSVKHRTLRWKPLSKLYHFFLIASGSFHSEVNAYHCFKTFLVEHLKTNKYDYILVTSPPLNIIKLGAELSSLYKIPLIVDFRDLWDNTILSKTEKIHFSRKLMNGLYKIYLKKWMKEARLCVSVSKSLIDEIKKLTDAKTLVITNGFEKNLFLNVPQKGLTKFTIAFIGTLYPNQQLNVLFDGLKLFLENKKEDAVQINFIGTSTIPEVKDRIVFTIPNEFLFITDRVARAEALNYTLNSHILFHAAWSGFKGIYSSKLFEYLGAERNILIAPGDNDVIDQVIHETMAGKIANSPQEVCNALEGWYKEWKDSGNLKYYGRKDIIEKYTRENQSNLFAEYILNNFKGSERAI